MLAASWTLACRPEELVVDASVGGLTEAEAQARLRTEGFNDLPATDHRTFLRIIGDVLREPMGAYPDRGDLKRS